MRLIDADALADWINEQREEVTKKQVAGTRESIFTKEALVTMQRCISVFENKIKTEPTAYDLNKVVEQLEDEQELSYADFEIYAEEHGLSEDDDWHHRGLGRAVEIVKRGGTDGKID